MPPFARVLPWLVLAFSLAALALGAYEWANPHFTDEQLRASLANTWEVAASTTRVFGIVFLGLGAISVVLARRATEPLPRLAGWLAAASCAITLLVFLRNHVELTQRVEQVTKQEFGPVYGLF